MPVTASRGLVRQTERWFVRHGVPTMIEGYGFVGHVLPRMLPTLVFVSLASMTWLGLLKPTGAERWVQLGGVVVLAVVVWATVGLPSSSSRCWPPRTASARWCARHSGTRSTTCVTACDCWAGRCP